MIKHIQLLSVMFSFSFAVSMICGCGGGGTVGTFGDCGSGEYQCDGTIMQKCENGMWEDYLDCADQGQICTSAMGYAECIDPEDAGGTDTDTSPDASD